MPSFFFSFKRFALTTRDKHWRAHFFFVSFVPRETEKKKTKHCQKKQLQFFVGNAMQYNVSCDIAVCIRSMNRFVVRIVSVGTKKVKKWSHLPPKQQINNNNNKNKTAYRWLQREKRNGNIIIRKKIRREKKRHLQIFDHMIPWNGIAGDGLAIHTSE